jgi:hypothetical protein
LSVEQFIALMGAMTALITTLGGILVQLRATHTLVNSRMTELVETTKLAAQKSGELVGRDFERASLAAGSSAEVQNETPTGTLGTSS